MKIAVLGPQGTFSDKAYLEYNKDLEAVYCPTIDEVFSAVCPDNDKEALCEYGIVPIENTLDGYVQRTLDLLLEKDVYILDENKVSVHFSLVGNVNSVEEIKELYVQFKANGQCRNFINSLKNISIISTESNMESYYKLGDKKGAAAIVPQHIAQQETSRFVVDNVTDAENNYTRFLVIQKGNVSDEMKHIFGALSKAACKKVRIPVYIMPATERPGILYEILKEFYDNKINLISIMSRPTKLQMGTYNFYIEIDGRFEELGSIMEALDKIAVYNDIKVLGIYKE